MNTDSGHGAKSWHFPPEYAFTQNRNQRSRSARMTVHDGPEYAQGKWFANEGELQRAFDHWRTVSGKLSVKEVSLSAGKAFRGERVGLKEMQEDGRYEV